MDVKLHFFGGTEIKIISQTIGRGTGYVARELVKSTSDITSNMNLKLLTKAVMLNTLDEAGEWR